MPNATANRVGLRYVAEVTPGTTPSNPSFKELRYTGDTLDFDRTSVTSKEIRDDRMTSDLVPVKGSSGGDVNIEFSAEAFDDLLEAAFCGTWGVAVAGVSSLKNGVVNRSFTLQKHFQDMSPNVYNTFRGQRVSDLMLDFKVGAILTGKFGFMGMQVVPSNSQISGATVAAAPTNTPMNAVSNLQEIEEDGVTSTSAFRSLTMNLNNNMREQEAIGSLFPIDIVPGTLEVTGNFEAYFSTMALYQKFINDQAFGLGFKTIDGEGNYYEWLLPKIKIESSKIEAGGLDTDVMISGSYRAIYDPVTDCMIEVKKFLAA